MYRSITTVLKSGKRNPYSIEHLHGLYIFSLCTIKSTEKISLGQNFSHRRRTDERLKLQSHPSPFVFYSKAGMEASGAYQYQAFLQENTCNLDIALRFQSKCIKRVYEVESHSSKELDDITIMFLQWRCLFMKLGH